MPESSDRVECPTWCVADHSDEPRHRGAISTVAAVVPGAPASITDLMLELHRDPGEPHAWLYIGDGESRSLEISAESARRLLDALAARLASLAE